jgi:hypothetical protein
MKNTAYILLFDDELSRFKSLKEKAAGFAKLIQADAAEISWCETVKTFTSFDKDQLDHFTLIMLDHDTPEMEDAGIICARHLIKAFEGSEGSRPVIWVHSTNTPRAEQMKNEMADAGFRSYAESFPRLMRRL